MLERAFRGTVLEMTARNNLEIHLKNHTLQLGNPTSFFYSRVKT